MIQKYDLVTKVTALVRTQLEEYPAEKNIEPITLFTDLGFDWMASIGLVMELEQEFSIVISDEDAQQFINVQSVVMYLQNFNK